MTHPRDRGPAGGIDRRRFLAAAAAITAAVPLAALLNACRKSAPSPAVAAIRQARQDHPVELPILPGQEAIADGLAPETDAVFRIYGWPAYVAPRLLHAFGDRYGCKIDYTSFRTMDEAIATLRTGSLEADLFFPATGVLGSLVAAEILQPINTSYIPNLQKNAWQSLVSPFYDRGPRYTVPYFVWTTGIAWRNDLVSADIRSMDNPYDVFWNSNYRGHVHLLNNSRDAVGMSLLRNGITDVNTSDPALISRARNDLLDLVDRVAPKLDHTDYRDLFSGEAHIHQSWSGNIGFSHLYAPEPSDVATLSFFWPPQHRPDVPGIIGSDTLAVPASAKNPVLAHLFMDYMLDSRNALANSAYEGYQAPVLSVTRERLIHMGAVAPNLYDVIVEQADFAKGHQELELTASADALWQEAYGDVAAAVSGA